MNRQGACVSRPQILVTSLLGQQNRGDWELTLALIDILRQAFPGCSIQGLCRDSDSAAKHFPGVSFQSLLGVSTRPPGLRRRLESSLSFTFGFVAAAFGILTGLCPNALARSYRRADFIVAAPGGYLEDINLGILMHVAHMWLALLARKPLLLAPLSVGPLSSAVWRMILAHLLRRVRLICVREPGSLALVRELLGPDTPHLHLLPDMALYRNETDSEGGARLLNDVGLADRPFVAMTVEDGQVPFYAGPAAPPPCHLASLAMFCRLLEADGLGVFIWLQAETAGGIAGDETAMTNFVRQAPGNVFASRERMSPAVIRGVLQRASALVTRRMHPCLFAIQVGCPFVSLSTEVKTRAILLMLELDDCVFDFSACNATALHARVLDAMRRSEAFHQASVGAARLAFRGRQTLLEVLRSSVA